MLGLAEESSRQFRLRFSGKTMTILWEQRAADGTWTGITGNYIRACTDSDTDLTNQLLPVTLP